MNKRNVLQGSPSSQPPSPPSLSDLEDRGPCPRFPEVKIYSGGAYMNPAREVGNPQGKGGGKRGIVKGWSTASRRRLREFLLCMLPPDGWRVVGATFTVPGPNLSPSDARKLWAWFSHEVESSGACMVWRLEVQRRGAVHWHSVIASPDRIPDRPLPGKRKKGPLRPQAGFFRELWWEAVGRLGPLENYHPAGGRASYSVEDRMSLPGASVHAACIQGDGSRGAWLRYLQDHASKTKQEQMAEGFGRHWGIVGRRHYRKAFPLDVLNLTPAAYDAFRRAYERLATPSRKEPRSPWGRCLGRRCKRGRIGKAVCFSRPETISRLVAWAVSEKGEIEQKRGEK